MNTTPHPPDLILAIVTIETWPPVEKPYPYPRKQSTPPKVEPWCSYPIYLVNRGDVPLDIEYSTGGFASDDDHLVETSVSSDTAHVEPREAALVETRFGSGRRGPRRSGAASSACPVGEGARSIGMRLTPFSSRTSG